MAYKKPENLEQGVKWLPSIQAMPVKLTLMSLWRARFLIKFLCVPFFLTELVASLLAGCHAKAGCQLARWRASFLKELAASLLAGVPACSVACQFFATFLRKLAASLLGGVPALLRKLAASLLRDVLVFSRSWLLVCLLASSFLVRALFSR